MSLVKWLLVDYDGNEPEDSEGERYGSYDEAKDEADRFDYKYGTTEMYKPVPEPATVTDKEFSIIHYRRPLEG